MPNIKQNIGLLRNGVQRKRARETATDDQADARLPVRDHYQRFEQYMKRQYPKRKQDRFTGECLAKRAEAAERNTPLGIIDTIAREFITFWMPEIELFLADNAYENEDIERVAYKRFVDGLEGHIMAVSDAVSCDKDKDAATLRDALQKRTTEYLADLYESCKEVLKDCEKPEFDPEQRSSRRSKRSAAGNTKALTEPLSEARTLNSSLAWSLADDTHESPPQRSTSPRIRHLSPIRQLDLAEYSEAADNGLAWGNSEASKREFKIEITNTIKIRGSESIEAFAKEHSKKRARNDDNVVDLTSDSPEFMPPGGVHSRDWYEGGDVDQYFDASEFLIPSAFSTF